MGQELKGAGFLLLILGELLPAKDVATVLEKGNQDGVVIVELSIGPSNVESFDVLIVCVLENRLIIEEQLTAFYMVLQINLKQLEFKGGAANSRVSIIHICFTIAQRAFCHKKQIVCICYVIEANLDFFIWHPYLYSIKALLNVCVYNN